MPPEDHFGEHVAERYDESAADMFEPSAVDPFVDFLAELAGRGRALELGVGTGRIASAPAVSRCRSRGGASACTASIYQPRSTPSIT